MINGAIKFPCFQQRPKPAFWVSFPVSKCLASSKLLLKLNLSFYPNFTVKNYVTLSAKTVRLRSFNHTYWALRPRFSNAFKCVLNFNYVWRPLLFRRVCRCVLICFAELKLESNNVAIWYLPKSNQGWVIVVKPKLWPQTVITQSSLPTLYFNNQGRERSAYPRLQTPEESFFAGWNRIILQGPFISCPSRMTNIAMFFSLCFPLDK